MFARIERRLRYELEKRSRDRARFKDAIADQERKAEVYVRNLGIDFGAMGSTGCEFTDYMLLHRYVRERKPRTVVELGSGKSSLVLAAALREEGGHLLTFEAIPEYHSQLLDSVPPRLRDTITAIRADAVETSFDGIRGVRFDVQIDAADFVFVDGPTEGLADGAKGACLDILFLLRSFPDRAVDVAIDQKFTTQDALESVLPGSVRYDPVMNLGYAAGVKGSMLRPPRRPWRIKHGNVWEMIQRTS